jgi:hypothetical protein
LAANTTKAKDVSHEAHLLAKRVARENRVAQKMRKWCVETAAMVVSDDLSPQERIRLAKQIEDYVTDGTVP